MADSARFYCINDFFHLVGYNEPEMVHCTYQGVTGPHFQDKMYLSLKIVFILVNSADPDEMPPYAISSLFAKLPVKGFPVYKELMFFFSL